MKIRKRFSGLMLSLLLLLALMAPTVVSPVLAATDPALSIESKTVSAGETCTVAISLTNAAVVYSGNFTLQYDSSRLTAESFAFGSIFNDHTKNCNLDYQSKGNLIRVTYSGAYALTGDGTLITLTFKAKEGVSGAAALQFNAYKLYNENGTALTGTATGGSVSVSFQPAATPQLSVVGGTVKAGQTVEVPVTVSNAAGVYSGNFTLQYDSSRLTAESYNFGSIFNDHTKNCNLDYQSKGNLIRVTYSGAYALTGDGTLITLTFKAKEGGSGSAAFQFTAYKLYDENGAALTGAATGGSVTVTPAEKVLSSISVMQMPAKTTYEIGESLSTDGLVIQRNYSDGSHDSVTTGFTVSGFNSVTAGVKTVTVLYDGKATSFRVTVNAAVPPVVIGAGVITIADGKANTGKTFDLDVNMTANPGFAYLKITLQYDSDALELTEAVNGTVGTDSFSQLGDNLVWDSDRDLTANGQLITLRFRVKDTAQAGAYTVNALVRECCNLQEIDVPFTVASGTVQITDIDYGDANGDGEINGKDVIRLRHYLVAYNEGTGISEVEIFAGADANGDGDVNGKDLIRLRNYLVHYDEKTGTSPIVLG